MALRRYSVYVVLSEFTLPPGWVDSFKAEVALFAMPSRYCRWPGGPAVRGCGTPKVRPAEGTCEGEALYSPNKGFAWDIDEPPKPGGGN